MMLAKTVYPWGWVIAKLTSWLLRFTRVFGECSLERKGKTVNSWLRRSNTCFYLHKTNYSSSSKIEYIIKRNLPEVTSQNRNRWAYLSRVSSKNNIRLLLCRHNTMIQQLIPTMNSVTSTSTIQYLQIQNPVWKRKRGLFGKHDGMRDRI